MSGRKRPACRIIDSYVFKKDGLEQQVAIRMSRGEHGTVFSADANGEQLHDANIDELIRKIDAKMTAALQMTYTPYIRVRVEGEVDHPGRKDDPATARYVEQSHRKLALSIEFFLVGVLDGNPPQVRCRRIPGEAIDMATGKWLGKPQYPDDWQQGWPAVAGEGMPRPSFHQDQTAGLIPCTPENLRFLKRLLEGHNHLTKMLHKLLHPALIDDNMRRVGALLPAPDAEEIE